MKQIYVVYDIAVGNFAKKISREWHEKGEYDLLGSFPIEADEAHKTLSTVEAICRALLVAGADRSTTLIAIGGGVTTDICGFAAAIYKRGIPVINIPTTLLSQVDAAIGGKTGVNMDGVKNSIGVIRLPEKVLFYSEPLQTLPAEQMRSGAAELLKTFLLFDSAKYDEAVRLFATLESLDYARLSSLVKAAAAYKEKIVRKDLNDRGKRHLLNLGHTLGHAIEWWQTKTGQSQPYTHGEAVAIGIIYAVRLSVKEGMAPADLADRLRADFRACGLPTELPCALEELLPAIRNDKKIEDAKIDFVYLKAIGRPELKKRRIEQIIL